MAIAFESIAPSAGQATDRITVRRGAGPADHTMELLTPASLKTLLSITTADVSGLAAVAASGSASDLTAGTLPAARFDDTAHGTRAGGTLHPAATTSVAGFMSGADKTKLDGVATGATANATDAALRDRATHTGAQLASTISDFNSAARAQIEAALIAGANITITPAGSGATRTLTIASSGGGGGATLISDAPATNQSNWSPAGFGSGVGTIKAQPTTNSFITGLAAGATDQTVLLVNDSEFVICLEKQSAASTAANRFKFRGGASFWLLPHESVTVRYSATLSRWVVVEASNDVLVVGRTGLIVQPLTSTGVASFGQGQYATTATISNTGPSSTGEFLEYGFFQGTSSTAAATPGIRANANYYMRGSVANERGFFHAGHGRITAISATGCGRLGMTSSTGGITTLSAAVTQCLLIGVDAGQTTLRVFHADGTAGTPVDLGANFPCPSATAAYEYCFYAPPNSSFVRYMVRRTDTRFVAEGTFTTNIPTNTQQLGPRVDGWVGATAAATTVQAAYQLTTGL